jgi:hypothetical protein
VLLRPSRYEANRAHLGVIDWQRTVSVTVNLSPWITSPLERVRIYDPTNLWGQPIATMTGPSFTLSVPNGAASFVLYKG